MKQLFILLAAVLLTATTYAQVGIGTTTPDASSALDITSTSKGLLIPRMTETQRNAIVSPASGLMIYQTDQDFGFYFYNGTQWASAGMSGNNGIDGEDGVDGLSAYDVWLSLGNTGTEQDFINSLTGPSGNGIESTSDNGDGTFTFDYTDGTSFTTSDLTGPQGNEGISSGFVNVFFGTPGEINMTNNPENSILFNIADNKFYLITYRGSSDGGNMFTGQSSTQKSSSFESKNDFILSFKVKQSIKLTGMRFLEDYGFELFQDKTNNINNGLGFEVDWLENGIILNPNFTYYVVIHGGVNNENPYGDRNEFTINDIFTDVSYFSVNFGNGYGPSNNNSTAPDSFRGNSTDISETLTQRNDILPMYNDNFNFTGVKNIEYEVLNNSLLLLPITGQ